MAPDSSRKRLPFEPTGKGKGAENKPSGSSLPKPEDIKDSNSSTKAKTKATKSRRPQSSSDASKAGASLQSWCYTRGC